jgi:predicted nuclease with TOPRIM domain
LNEKIEESIKKNSGILRQFTSLNNEMKDLRGRVKKLEEEGSYFTRVENIKGTASQTI